MYAGARRRRLKYSTRTGRSLLSGSASFVAACAVSSGPWTNDPVLLVHRFTNPYRAADRVSQYLIRHVAYAGTQGPDEVLLRVVLFKLFNRIATWDLLERAVGPIACQTFDVQPLRRCALRSPRRRHKDLLRGIHHAGGIAQLMS